MTMAIPLLYATGYTSPKFHAAKFQTVSEGEELNTGPKCPVSSTDEVSWCFEPSQTPMIISGLTAAQITS